jgi:RNA polymerase sigma-70 factor (ECF subfamily)
MTRASDSQTRITLLERLARTGAPDQAAWGEFVEHYGRKIYEWCLRWKLQHADAQDVTQNVLLNLAVRMKDFTYDPSQSFRAWLKTVAHHAWRDFLLGRQRVGQGPARGGSVAQLESVEAREDLLKRVEEQFDRELLEMAMQVVRGQVAPHNWRAFCLTALNGRSAAEVARQLDMRVARVYAARSHIQQRLREECRKLEGDLTPGRDPARHPGEEFLLDGRAGDG